MERQTEVKRHRESKSKSERERDCRVEREAEVEKERNRERGAGIGGHICYISLQTFSFLYFIYILRSKLRKVVG